MSYYAMKDSTDVVLENFDGFIKENSDSVRGSNRIAELFAMDNMFESFVTSLLEGTDTRNHRQVSDDPVIRQNIRDILNREREIITESISSAPGQTSLAHGWMVSMFPILTDIYSDPILNQICTLHVSKSPVFSLTRMFLEGTVANSDGTTTSKRMPSTMDTIRGKEEVITVLPNTENNLFVAAAASLDFRNSAINKSFFHVFQITVTDNDDGTGSPGGGPTSHVVDIIARPTGRDNITYSFTFKSGPEPAAGVADTRQTAEGTILGHMNWDKGTYTYSVTFKNLDNAASTVSYTVTNSKCKVFFTARSTDVNLVDVSVKEDIWDINIGVRDSFRIKLEAESIQDYQSIYDVDKLRTIMLGIKNQILLNKDRDISMLLQMYEPEMKTSGSSSTVDLAKYEVSGGRFGPDDPTSVFKGIMTGIEKVNASIYANKRAWPQILVTGPSTHAVLKSIQSPVYATKDQANSGTLGYGSAGVIQFGNQMVIRSNAVPTNKIYHIYKPGSDDPGRATMLDIIYHPLYVIEEITNSIKYTYLRSRTTLEVVDTRGLGVTTLKGYEDYFGNL